MNPQSELFEILAESNLRNRSIRAIYARSVDTIDRRYRQLAQQIRAMRQQLDSRPELQPKYRKAIGDLQRLGQSYALGKTRLNQRIARDKNSSELQKALDYGELLLEIYGVYGDSKSLIKGANMDLKTCANYLHKFSDLQAQELSKKLLALTEH